MLSHARSLLLGLAGLSMGLMLFEGFCQIYARIFVYPELDRVLADHRHYLVKSANPVLGYELAPGYSVESNGRRLTINSHGLRADSDDLFAGRRKLALLGDSVAMSHAHSQEKTLARRLEARLQQDDADIVVLNFGVGGYGFDELVEFLRVKDRIYDVDHVLYLLNPNDYARRNSIYEGADNGTYRLYYRPLVKGPWFLRKAVYRHYKNGMDPSTSWYEWMFRGNEANGYRRIAEMADYCRENGCAFSVVLLPAGVSYTEDGYQLQEMYDAIGSYLAKKGIPYLSPIEEIGEDPAAYMDPTDHFYDAGIVRMAEAMHAFLRQAAQ